MKISLYIGLSLLCFTFFSSIQAQNYKRILGKPYKFERPIDYSDQNQKSEFQFAKSKMDKEVPWIVICDRDKNATYSKPDENSPVKETLNFRDFFYVVAQNDEWIHLVKARTSGLRITKLIKDYGWVRKDKMLLWTAGLIDERTKIHKKTFLLNKVQDINRIIKDGSKDFAKIYLGPDTNKEAEKRSIYEFYFVYKKENDRYLIAKESLLSSSRLENLIVGWVNRQKAADWNTRIALEPNFQTRAYEERKKNKKLRVIGYSDIASSDAFARTGIPLESKIAWDNDPIQVDSHKLANSNPHRFKGGVVRFPMLQNYPQSYMSGAIGEIQTQSLANEFSSMSEINYSGILEGLQNTSAARTNYNIFFVIEGTRQLSKYKQAILNTIDNLETKFDDVVDIRYGAAIYRDTPEEKVNKLLEIQPLINDKSKVINFINNAQFELWYDNDEYTALYYGMNEVLLKGGFSDEHTNIIFLIADNADYKFDRVRRTIAEDQEDKTYIAADLILDQLATINAHLISIQCNHQGNRSCTKYPQIGRSFIVEASKKQHSEYSKIEDYYPGTITANPEMGALEAGDIIELVNGPNVGKLFKPSFNSSISPKELQEFLNHSIDEISVFVEEHFEAMSALLSKGDALDLSQSSGYWSASVAREMYKLIKENEKSQKFSPEDVRKIIDQKYYLYKEIYLAKKVNGANNDALSYVMYMPKEDLKDYIRTLRRLALSVDMSLDKQREALFLTFTELLKQFTGNAEISRKQVEKTSVDELRALMQGIQEEGLVFGGQMDFKIGNILSPKEMNEDELRNLISQILNKLEELEKIYKLGDRYEFSYKTVENVYFWIPIEYAL